MLHSPFVLTLHSYSARHNLGYSAQNKPKKTYKTKGVDFHMEYVRAFVIGGTICVIGQLLIDLTKLTPARIMVAYVHGRCALGCARVVCTAREFRGLRRQPCR